MPENITNPDAMEQQIIAYLHDHGPARCPLISADLDLDPFLVLNTLHRLYDDRRIRFANCTTLHEPRPLQ